MNRRKEYTVTDFLLTFLGVGMLIAAALLVVILILALLLGLKELVAEAF